VAIPQDGISVNRRRSSSKEDRLANIIKVVAVVLDGLGVPKYSSEHSNRLYSVHAKIGLLVIKQHQKKTFRSLCDLLASAPRVLKAAGMKFIPDHSTLVKFSALLDKGLLDSVLSFIASLLCDDGILMAMDATGSSCSSASSHYVKRMREMGCQTMEVSNYTKATIAADTATLAVIACETSLSNVHDVKHVPAIMEKVVSGGFGVRCVVAYKGYDSENVHEQIRKRLSAESVIPVRDPAKRSIGRVEPTPKGKNRKKMVSLFPSDDYNRRPLVETVNSMIKRKMGDIVYGHSDESRHREVMFKCISHNMTLAFEAGVV